MFVEVFVYLFIYLLIYLFGYLFIYLFIYLLIYLFTFNQKYHHKKRQRKCALLKKQEIVTNSKFVHSQKKHKGSLEGSLNRVLFAAELEFSKMLVPSLPQNTSNVSNECAGKSKQLYSLSVQVLLALIYLHFTVLTLIGC